MGTLRSTENLAGLGVVVNGVTLGEPVGTWEDGTLHPPFLYDDGAYPNGEIDAEGVVTPDEIDLP